MERIKTLFQTIDESWKIAGKKALLIIGVALGFATVIPLCLLPVALILPPVVQATFIRIVQIPAFLFGLLVDLIKVGIDISRMAR